jgi:hypothetical protein
VTDLIGVGDRVWGVLVAAVTDLIGVGDRVWVLVAVLTDLIGVGDRVGGGSGPMGSHGQVV